MRSVWFYSFVALLLLLIGIATYMIFFTENSIVTDEQLPNYRQSDSESRGVTSDRYNLITAEGPIEVNDFLSKSRTFADPVNPGHYQLGYYLDPTTDKPQTIPFYIEFFPETQHFIVSLQQEPLSESRQAAEQFLIEYLGITESELCSLSYMVSVPARVSIEFSGKSLGFSFCEGAVTL